MSEIPLALRYAAPTAALRCREAHLASTKRTWPTRSPPGWHEAHLTGRSAPGRYGAHLTTVVRADILAAHTRNPAERRSCPHQFP